MASSSIVAPRSLKTKPTADDDMEARERSIEHSLHSLQQKNLHSPAGQDKNQKCFTHRQDCQAIEK
eukprot:3266633-Prorocentrum_lima.AAC.1